MNTPTLSLERAVQISEQAFVPFSAVVQTHREDASFALRVLDDAGNCLASLPHIARVQSANPLHLAGILEQLRLEMSKDGHVLSAWSMPFQADPDLP